MKIRYQPSHRGSPDIILRDILGGHALAKWRVGDERDIPPDLKVAFRGLEGAPTQLDAVEAVFRHGPDFVDATTGKNPLYTCVDCGDVRMDECWFDKMTYDEMPFVDDAGRPLCIADYLAHHPERIVEFVGRDKAMKPFAAKAREILTKREAAAAPPPSAAAPVKPSADTAASAAQGA